MEVETMKKTAPAVIMALAIATLVVISLGCSNNSSPAQSVFAAEHGQWVWLESEGGLNTELIQVDSVDYYRVLQFTEPPWAILAEFDKEERIGFYYFQGPYSITWETHDSERVQVVRYSGGAYAPQIMGFLGNDTLVLTDLAVNGYTHTYLRVY
jgi:hypothetical protein